MVYQTVGVRERENERVLLHGKQQVAGPFFPAGVPAHHQAHTPAKEDIPIHPGGRGEENGQGHTYRDEPGTAQQ